MSAIGIRAGLLQDQRRDMKRLALLSIGFFLFLPIGSSAETYSCTCQFIEGLEVPQGKGAKILGPATGEVPEKMSVYLSVDRWKGQQALYLLSNFKPKGQNHPNNMATTDGWDLPIVIYRLGHFGSQKPFNCSEVTYYVGPSVFKDPYWGSQIGDLIGTVCVLGPDGTVQGRYVQKDPGERPVAVLTPPVPSDWVEIVQGVPQSSGASLPPEFLERSKRPNTRWVVLDPKSLVGTNETSMALESSSEEVVPGHDLSLTFLKDKADQYSQSCSCQVVESKAFMSNGQPVVRIIQFRTTGTGQTNLCSFVYYFQHGWDLDTFTGICPKSQYAQYGPIFQDAFQNMLKTPSVTRR